MIVSGAVSDTATDPFLSFVRVTARLLWLSVALRLSFQTILGKEYYYSVLEDTGLIDMIASEIPDFSVVFLSMEKVLVTIDGEPFETTYRITPSRDLYVDGWDGVEREFGIFSENYEEIRLTIEDTFPAYLVRQD